MQDDFTLTELFTGCLESLAKLSTGFLNLAELSQALA